MNHLYCDTISGSTKWHSFRSSRASTWTIWIRDLACFYQTCIIHDSKSCENIEWVEEWKQRSLTPSQSHDDPQETIVEDELFVSKDYDRISDLVQ